MWNTKKIEPAAQEEILGFLRGKGATTALDPADRAMLAYAVKLTETPGKVVAGDVEALHAAGFDDRAIHDICAIAAYFAFVNRIADGLGVNLEERFGDG